MATEQKALPAQPVLIVDDDEESLFALVVTLRSAGITNLRTVSDSTVVPAMLTEEAFSLVLLDLNMPGLSGHEVLQKTADLENRPPIIIVTGSSRPGDLAQGYGDGVVDCLVKPVDRDRLVRVVRTALARSHR
jgi:two-component system response regulator FlrC